MKESYLRQAEEEYVKRLRAYCSFKSVEIKERSELPGGKCVSKEGEDILKVLPDKAYKIAMCIEGKQLSSEELAKHFDDVTNRGFSEIAFIIGGSDGLSEEVKGKCDMRLSFSKLTFPHQLMRVILTEQIYRSFTILAGGKYHK